MRRNRPVVKIQGTGHSWTWQVVLSFAESRLDLPLTLAAVDCEVDLS